MAFPLNFTLEDDRAIKPERVNDNSVAFYLFSPERVVLKPNTQIKIKTGLSFEMVGPYYAQLENVVENEHFLLLGGVIDPGYRGNITVPLFNVSDKVRIISRKDKIALLVFVPAIIPELINEEEMDNIDRKNLQVYIIYTKTNPFAFVPTRFDESSVGFDLRALEDIYVPPLGTLKVDIGICLKMTGGSFFGQIRNRSGFSTRRELYVFNGPLDSNHRGPILVHLKNLTNEGKHIFAGDGIAQIIFIPCIIPTFVYKSDIDRNTTRGDRGFGSSDIKSICDN